MSYLERMSIYGVRSFSPDEPQLITFSSPLSLILGPNGTGKTTIIECLRYITTGDYPPNSDRGQAFVHDPKLAGEREIKGQIKLKFTDTSGKVVTATRTMEVQQMAKRLQVKSLDGTIVRKDDQGEKYSISSKCTELDREMVSMLGVSEAILNNVIFCHQEESNWPLNEGKALKVKFDDIFAATRYVKALENLHSIRNKHETEAKTLTIELKHVEQCKIQSAKMKSELQKNEARLAMSQDRIQKVKQSLTPIQQKLNEIGVKERIISKVQEELIQKRTQCDMEKESCDKIRSQISNEFTGSTADLRITIREFEGQFEVKKSERENIASSIDRLEGEIKENTVKQKNVLIQLGRLNTEAKKNTEDMENRDKLAKNLNSSYNLSVKLPDTERLSTSDFDEILSKLKDKFQWMSINAEKLKSDYGEKERKLQTQLDSLNETKSRMLQTQEIRRKQIEDSEKKIRVNSDKLREIKSSVEKLAQVEVAHKEKVKELEAASALLDEEAAVKEIESIEVEIASKDRQIRLLDNEMLELNKQVGILAQLEMYRKDKKLKDDAIKKIKSKHEDTLIHLLGNIPSTNIRYAVEEFARKLKQEIGSMQLKRSDLKVNLATFENNRKAAKDELNKKEKELLDSEDQIFQVSGSRDLETTISQIDGKIKNLHDEKGSFIGAQYLYRTYIEKLKRKDPCCPLCHRDFSESQDVVDLVNELDNKLKIMPTELETKQKSIEDQQRERNRLSEMRPVKCLIEKLTGDIPTLKSKWKSYENQIEKCRNDLNDLEDLLMVKQSDEAIAAGMNKDLVTLENHLLESKKVEKLIFEAENKLGTVGERTVAIVNEEKTEIQSQLANLQTSNKEKQQTLKDYTNRRNRLQIEVNRLGAEIVKISKDAQTTTELQNQIKQFNKEISNCHQEVTEIKDQLAPIQMQIQEITISKDSVMKLRESELEKCQRLRQDLKAKTEEVTGLHANILRYLQNQGPGKLKICQEEEEKIQKVIRSAEDLKQQLNRNWQELSKDIDNFKTKLRELQDCLLLREKQEKLNLLKTSISELEEKLGGFDHMSILKEKRLLIQKDEKLNAEINQEQGKHRELEKEIQRQKDDLQVDMYRDVEKKYTEKLVELKTTKIVSNDLHKYYLALDSAIMQYHGMKMTEINKIIRDLWGKTYKGNDIDFIEIRSEASETKGASSKRQYNYKVVMIKGDVEQVMRGRCSAGQKVLASLIIRMALAETFCLNCGVMALDEPTTNLDKENVFSLCDALAEIVELRSSERHFQLIVISHDEDFVSRLGRTASAEYYHILEKDSRGHSTISRQSTLQLTESIL